MDKEKEIEEMNDIISCCWNTISAAQKLYNAGYRKLSEDSVVLSKGAYESLSSKAKANVVNAVEIRRDTAKEILSDLYFNLQSSVQGKVAKSNDYYNVYGWIKEIAEEYGVEVEE